MASARPRQTTVAEHLAGSKDSWHGQITSDGPFKLEKNRYHLYIGLFCPFAHRANLVRHLKNLTSIIDISVVRPYPKGDSTGWPGWRFPATLNEYPGSTPDPLFSASYLHELYFKADEKYQGRYSVPVLWDKQTQTIVNNESTELIRILGHAFDDVIEDQAVKDLDFYPVELRDQIDEICGWMQRDLNTGVYKAGFAVTQDDYDKNVPAVFAALNKIEEIIAENKGPFVLGKRLTEVDLRLYPTVIRFDVVYVQHFKCNLGMIRSEYPQIYNWMKGLYWGEAELEMSNGPPRKIWGFGELDLEKWKGGSGTEDGTVEFRHIKENYTKSHDDINPKAITPTGPWPNIGKGYERDFSKVPIGGIDSPEVLELQAKLGR